MKRFIEISGIVVRSAILLAVWGVMTVCYIVVMGWLYTMLGPIGAGFR